MHEYVYVLVTHVGWAAADVVEDLVPCGSGGGGGASSSLVGGDVDGVVVGQEDPARGAGPQGGVQAQGRRL